MSITQEQLKKLITYDPETGLVAQLPRRGVSDTSPRAGYSAGNNYRVICVMEHSYYVHRLAWMYMTGEWPQDQVDHINGDTTDNRWVNLRAATRVENGRNTPRKVVNTSGVKGISWHKPSGRWQAIIRDGKRQITVGYSKDLNALAEKLKTVRESLHGQFAHHGG